MQADFTDKLHKRLNAFMDLLLLLKITFPTKGDVKHEINCEKLVDQSQHVQVLP